MFLRRTGKENIVRKFHLRCKLPSQGTGNENNSEVTFDRFSPLRATLLEQKLEAVFVENLIEPRRYSIVLLSRCYLNEDEIRVT